jgi:hypothetical protein
LLRSIVTVTRRRHEHTIQIPSAKTNIRYVGRWHLDRQQTVRIDVVSAHATRAPMSDPYTPLTVETHSIWTALVFLKLPPDDTVGRSAGLEVDVEFISDPSPRIVMEHHRAIAIECRAVRDSVTVVDHNRRGIAECVTRKAADGLRFIDCTHRAIPQTALFVGLGIVKALVAVRGKSTVHPLDLSNVVEDVYQRYPRFQTNQDLVGAV